MSGLNLDRDTLQLFFDESDIDWNSGTVDVIPNTYEDLKTYTPYVFISSEEFYDTKKYFEDLIASINDSVKLYHDGYETYLELSDDPIINWIDSDIDEFSFDDLVQKAIEDFEDETGVNIFLFGRNYRHVCIELSLENLIEYNRLKSICEKLQKELINAANNYSTVEESFGYDTSVDDPEIYEIDASLNDDIDFDKKIVNREELFDFVQRVADLYEEDAPENEILAISTFLGDYDIYISVTQSLAINEDIDDDNIYNIAREVVELYKDYDFYDFRDCYDSDDEGIFETASALKDENVDNVIMYLNYIIETEAGELKERAEKILAEITDFLRLNESLTEDFDGDDEWIEVKSKRVYDSDGFMDDYTMYKNSDGTKYIFMYGDKDVYEPDEAYADWVCETEEEAYDWFDSYEGTYEPLEGEDDSQEWLDDPDIGIFGFADEPLEEDLDTTINVSWDDYEDYSEDEIEEINDILDNYELSVDKVEESNVYDDFDSVLVRDSVSGYDFWIDFRIKDGEIDYVDWNQNIFSTRDHEDRIRKALQTAYSDDWSFFNDVEEVAERFLLNSKKTNENISESIKEDLDLDLSQYSDGFVEMRDGKPNFVYDNYTDAFRGMCFSKMGDTEPHDYKLMKLVNHELVDLNESLLKEEFHTPIHIYKTINGNYGYDSMYFKCPENPEYPTIDAAKEAALQRYSNENNYQRVEYLPEVDFFFDDEDGVKISPRPKYYDTLLRSRFGDTLEEDYDWFDNNEYDYFIIKDTIPEDAYTFIDRPNGKIEDITYGELSDKTAKCKNLYNKDKRQNFMNKNGNYGGTEKYIALLTGKYHGFCASKNTICYTNDRNEYETMRDEIIKKYVKSSNLDESLGLDKKLNEWFNQEDYDVIRYSAYDNNDNYIIQNANSKEFAINACNDANGKEVEASCWYNKSDYSNGNPADEFYVVYKNEFISESVTTRPIATYYVSGDLGIIIYNINYDIDDEVVWAWSNTPDEIETSVIEYEYGDDEYDSRAFFMADDEKIYLDQCLRSFHEDVEHAYPYGEYSYEYDDEDETEKDRSRIKNYAKNKYNVDLIIEPSLTRPGNGQMKMTMRGYYDDLKKFILSRAYKSWEGSLGSVGGDIDIDDENLEDLRNNFKRIRDESLKESTYYVHFKAPEGDKFEGKHVDFPVNNAKSYKEAEAEFKKVYPNIDKKDYVIVGPNGSYHPFTGEYINSLYESSLWTNLNGMEQQAAETAIDLIQYGVEVDDAVKQAISRCHDAMDDMDIEYGRIGETYEEEPIDEAKVIEYVKSRI